MLCCLAASPLLAEALALPSNVDLTFESTRNEGSYAAPVAPYSGGLLPVFNMTGRVNKQAYRIPQQGITPEQILAPIEESLAEAGFEILFKCNDRFCGGFDFRFATDVIAAPDMFVDLFDYRFLTARRSLDDARSDYVTALASRDSTSGYLQLVQVTPEGATPLQTKLGNALVADVATSAISAPKGSIGAQLESLGRAILADLTFETGSSELGSGPFASLDSLAAYLLSNPNRRIALVGHTDTVGSLAGNITLARQRASSVMKRLASFHNVPSTQMEAEGMGYLAPVLSNLTPEGREANRRVEVVLLNTE